MPPDVTLDLRTDPRARVAVKKSSPVTVRFATEAGVCQTLEGPVPYQPGDAILTGNFGDSWPVSRARFDARYQPAESMQPGFDGPYVKLPLNVLVLQLAQSIDVRILGGGFLHGEPGDWLVQHAPGEFGIVRDDIFLSTYIQTDSN